MGIGMRIYSGFITYTFVYAYAYAWTKVRSVHI